MSPMSFQTGGIYMTNDQKILFPERHEIKDKPRMVVVLGREKDLNDPLLATVQAIPITTKLELKTTQDVFVTAGTGNLDENSLFKAGMVQPILKTDLCKCIGVLPEDELVILKTQVFVNLGFADEEDLEDKAQTNNIKGEE